MKLYYAPNACSLAPHIALGEAGATFEPVRLDLKRGDQRSSDYLAINPKGRVPALVTDWGTLTENPAILGFIAQSYPHAQLKPEGDLFAFWQMQAFNMYLATTIHVTFSHLFRAERYADSQEAQSEIKSKVASSLALYWKVIENQLSDGRPWVMGSHYTVADPYLYVFARWLERQGAGGIGRFSHTRAHANRMQERQAVKNVLGMEGLEPV